MNSVTDLKKIVSAYLNGFFIEDVSKKRINI